MENLINDYLKLSQEELFVNKDKIIKFLLINGRNSTEEENALYDDMIKKNSIDLGFNVFDIK